MSMREIRSILTEATWFQGPWGRSKPMRLNHRPEAKCLYTAARTIYGEETYRVLRRMASAIERLFPSRFREDQASAGAYDDVVVCFNNHDDTTWEDVDKVLRALVEEEDEAV